MKNRVVVLIDGGNLRVLAKKAGYIYDNDLIEKVAHACCDESETIFRILYYDCPPYRGKAKLPISGKEHSFDGPDDWLRTLATRNLFAVRRGVLKFRGFKAKRGLAGPPNKDEDFVPDFEQKGVDMRIGLDIASYSTSRLVDRIVLISADTDCIPALKHCRKAGLQAVIIKFPSAKLSSELLAHVDYTRSVGWPVDLRKLPNDGKKVAKAKRQ